MSSTIVDFEARAFPDEIPYKFLHQNNRDTFFLALCEIADLRRLLQKENAPTVIAEHSQLTSKQIYDLHSRFTAEVTQAFGELAEENASAKVIP